MTYDLYVNEDKIGNGLSRGELNQWLLDLDSELSQDEKVNFRKDLGADSGEDFEEFLYSNNLVLPVKVKHKIDVITIKENDF